MQKIENDWIDCENVNNLLRMLQRRATERKLRLFASACARRVWNLPFNERQSWEPTLAIHEPEQAGKRKYRCDEIQIERNRSAVETAERCADGYGAPEDLSRAFKICEVGTIGRSATKKLASSAASETAALCRLTACTLVALSDKSDCHDREDRAQCMLLRDIFGNPFRPVTLDPRWLTSTVLDLASTIYEHRQFEKMPILADALMDAGCDSEEIINHCQGPGPHVRGCWVVDLLLRKT